MLGRGVYSAVLNAATSGTSAVTLIEVEPAAGAQLVLIRAWIGNTTSEVSEAWQVKISRQSTDGTNVTSPVVVNASPGGAAHGGSVRGMCTTQGTETDILYSDGFNVLNGWLWVPTIDERFEIDDAATVGMRVAAPPSSITISAGLVFAIIG